MACLAELFSASDLSKLDEHQFRALKAHAWNCMFKAERQLRKKADIYDADVRKFVGRDLKKSYAELVKPTGRQVVRKKTRARKA